MRRPAVLLSIALLAGALLARHLRRRHAPTTPLVAPEPVAPLVPTSESNTYFVSVPWTLVEASPTEPELKIRYAGAPQVELDRIDAQETPTQVFVTVLMRTRVLGGGSFANPQYHEALVPLAQPLGERELVHAPVDADAPARSSPAADSDPADGEPSGPPLYP